MKKRWIVLGVGLIGLAGLGYLGWREVMGGKATLNDRDYNALRAALLERQQTEAGRDPAALNVCEIVERWRLAGRKIHASMEEEWAARGEKLPPFSYPLRANSPQRTEEKRAEQDASDAAWARYYQLALEAGLSKTLDDIGAAPRAVRPGRGPVGEDDTFGSTLRSLARLCRHRMMLAAAAHDSDAYRTACRQMVRLADASARQHRVLDRLVGCAIDSLAIGAVQEDLATGAISPELAADSAKIIADGYASWPKWSSMYEGESLDGQQMLMSSPNAAWIGTNEIGRIRRAYADLAAGADLPRAERIKVFEGVDQAVAGAPAWHMRLRLLLPALTMAGRAKDQQEVEIAGLQTVVAIERCKAETGSLPQSLQNLVPKYLPAVPADPFGVVVLYKRLDAPDRNGRSYLVYSVGMDQRDNGGAVSPKGGYVALQKPPESTGFDYPLSAIDGR